MYCPHCGQERTSSETRFCSRCGFLLAGVAELLANGGVLPNTSAKQSKIETKRNRGLKQGLFIFLLTFLVVPLAAFISVGFRIGPWPIAVSAVLLTVGGLLRMAYALMFESIEPITGSTAPEDSTSHRNALDSKGTQQALPPQQSIPISDYDPPAGSWRDTKDLQPTSVTEGTTRLLEKDQ